MKESITLTIPLKSLSRILKDVENNEAQQIVMISKEELNELEKRADHIESVGWMTIDELCEKMNRSRKWVLKYFIDDPFFRRKIEGFSTFSKNGSGKYNFDRIRMLKFLEEWTPTIMERSKKRIKLEKNTSNSIG